MTTGDDSKRGQPHAVKRARLPECSIPCSAPRRLGAARGRRRRHHHTRGRRHRQRRQHLAAGRRRRRRRDPPRRRGASCSPNARRSAAAPPARPRSRAAIICRRSTSSTRSGRCGTAASSGEPDLLASCYRTALDARRRARPAIHRVPGDLDRRVSLPGRSRRRGSQSARWCRSCPRTRAVSSRVVFCCFSEESAKHHMMRAIRTEIQRHRRA